MEGGGGGGNSERDLSIEKYCQNNGTWMKMCTEKSRKRMPQGCRWIRIPKEESFHLVRMEESYEKL